jgi:branched-chain amino acid transport system substrate-binding protein
MARQSFRGGTLLGAALTASFALLTSACTPVTGPPQAYEPPPPMIQATPEQMPLPTVAAAPAPAQTPLQMVTAGRTKVALLAPLSGPNKTVGQAMLDAANMALFDVSSDLALLPRDTGSTADGARAAAVDALSNGAGLILGPVFSASIPPVREAAEAGAAQGAPVNVIAFTTDAGVAGGDVLVMGFLPAQQVERVVGFAKSRGMTKLAVLAPDNAYGAAVVGAVAAIQGRLGLQTPRILTVGRDPKGQIASLADDPPQMLLVALGGDQLIGLAPALAEFSAAHPVQLLGTGLWDDPALAQVSGLAGGWYAAPIPDNFNGFANRFERIYNYKPPRIATLAYDSVALATSITRNSGGNPNPFNLQTLLQPNGFVGIDGGFRFLPSGLSERNLAVLAVSANGPVVVDPPPPGFEQLGQ